MGGIFLTSSAVYKSIGIQLQTYVGITDLFTQRAYQITSPFGTGDCNDPIFLGIFANLVYVSLHLTFYMIYNNKNKSIEYVFRDTM